MHHRFNTVCSDLMGFLFPAQLYARAGRLLLLLASIVLIALPFTQHLWTWDRFLHGGHDFETNVLLIVITLCLVLVMVQSCRQGVQILINASARLFVPRPQVVLEEARRDCDQIAGSSMPSWSLPLQI
jgi:hypothetical protein